MQGQVSTKWRDWAQKRVVYKMTCWYRASRLSFCKWHFNGNISCEYNTHPTPRHCSLTHSWLWPAPLIHNICTHQLYALLSCPGLKLYIWALQPFNVPALLSYFGQLLPFYHTRLRTDLALPTQFSNCCTLQVPKFAQGLMRSEKQCKMCGGEGHVRLHSSQLLSTPTFL